MHKFKTVEEFEAAFDDDRLYTEYAEFIMENCHGDRPIGNGDMLIDAMEEHYLYDAFQESMMAASAEL